MAPYEIQRVSTKEELIKRMNKRITKHRTNVHKKKSNRRIRLLIQKERNKMGRKAKAKITKVQNYPRLAN